MDRTSPRPLRGPQDAGWRAIKALYLRCTRASPERRRALLARAGAHRRAAVERLLRSSAQPDVLPTGRCRGDEHDAGRWLGTLVGPYRLVSVLGAGGMGIVYRGEREVGGFEQRVAVKLLPAGAAVPSRDFARECQMLAKLRHPHIAALLDGGTTAAGVPYLVLEYVEGEPLHAFCDRRALPVRARVALFCKVAHAVAHAHRHLILHCDIKPANVMVDADGSPKLLDFGIARLLGGDGAAPCDEPLESLSPAWASPEVLAGDAPATSSDVWSLGLLLHALLSGSLRSARRAELAPLLPSQAFARMLRVDPAGAARIARQRGASPRALARRLRGDLDAIVGRALDLDPARRYGSVLDLARDGERHLAHFPVAARGDAPLYRAGRFALRHRASVALGALSGAGLLASVVAIGAALQEAEAEKARAVAALGRAETERARAEMEKERYADLHRIMHDLLGSAAPGESRGEELTARDLLDRAVERLRLEPRPQPRVEAPLRTTIGGAFLSLGSYERALKQYRTALGLLDAAPQDPAPPESLDARNGIVKALFEQGELREAEVEARRAVELAERSDAHRLASALNNLAAILRVTQRLDAAAELHMRALALREQHEGPDSLPVAESLNNLASLQTARGRHAEALPLMERSLAIRRARLGDDHPLVIQGIANAAMVRLARGDHAAAILSLREADRLAERVLGTTHPERGRVLGFLGNALLFGGQYEAAIEALERAATCCPRPTPGDQRRRADLLALVGHAHLRARHPARARDAFAESERLYGEVPGLDPEVLARAAAARKHAASAADKAPPEGGR